MRKIKKKKNYTKYVLVVAICVFSCMGIGYSYLQETLSIHMSLSKKGLDITDEVVTTGDGLYEDAYETGRYIYRGNEPDNYIWFNEALWRIIAKESDGTYKGTVTEDSTMYEYLNETYYQEMTSEAKNQIQFHTYNIGPVQKLMDETDSIHKNIEGEKMYRWTGNVGLINVSDVLKASLNASCVSVTAAV